MPRWIMETKDDDIVISSRIRLARNISDYKFPNLLGMEDSEELTTRVLDSLKDSDLNYDFYRTRDMTDLDRNFFVEEHLISPSLLRNRDLSSFLVSQDERVTIMINEEDHIRIQVLLPGFNLLDGFEIATEIDDKLEDSLEYAFHEEYGYLTACPTNVGTGLRASVMLNLSGTYIMGQLEELIQSLSKIGLVVRGIYGEGSQGIGHLYQVSNQTTLGQSEEDIIKKLSRVIYEIVNKERQTRTYLIENKRLDIEDGIFRSLGIMKYSRKISGKEAMVHLANVKLGVDLGVLEGIKSKDITKLMIKVQPANIQKKFKKEMDKDLRDISRAEYIRDYFSKLEG